MKVPFGIRIGQGVGNQVAGGQWNSHARAADAEIVIGLIGIEMFLVLKSLICRIRQPNIGAGCIEQEIVLTTKLSIPSIVEGKGIFF